MIALRWHLARIVAALRWQGVAGLALAGVAILIYLSGIQPEMARASRLQQEAKVIQDAVRAGGATEDARQRVQESWPVHFFRLLPARSNAPDLLRAIHAAARAQGLSLEQGDYKLKIERNGRLIAYEVGLPMRGTYVQVRQFIAEVLERIPAAALDEFSVKRETVAEPVLEAAIRFTLFMDAR